METDDNQATLRESFSLVQNILFIGYTKVVLAHYQENRYGNVHYQKFIGYWIFFIYKMPSKKISLKTCGKNHAIWFVVR